jgi:agmatinase
MNKKLKTILQQILCPAGSGVYTVHTASQFRQHLQQHLYQEIEPALVQSRWLSSIEKINPHQSHTFLLGIPSDNGGGIHRGANWGPLFIRLKLLELFPDIYPHDLGDIRVIPHLLQDSMLSHDQLEKCREILYQNSQSELPVSPLSIAEIAADAFYQLYPEAKLLGLGGDHSVSFPLVKSFLKHRGKKRTGIIHFDAHTDLLMNRLGVDICFGSWAYHIIGMLQLASDLMQIGIRSSGRDRQHWQQTYGVQQWWSKELLQEGGIQKCIDDILAYIKNENIEQVYVSFDIDCLDSNFASATGTPESHGPGPHHVALILDALQSKITLAGADLVEVAPMIAWENAPKNGRDITLTNAALIASKLLQWSKN